MPVSGSVNHIVNFAFGRGYRNLFDIGSRDGDDAAAMGQALGITDIHCFEANPRLAEYIRSRYPYFKVTNKAVSSQTGVFSFNAVSGEHSWDIQGMSSLLDRNDDAYVGRSEKISVPVIPFSDYCKENGIDTIDLVKIDVEGCSYEVLCGFGEFLLKTRMIQLEAEHKQFWKNQRLYSDIKQMLSPIFKEVFNDGNQVQCDSIWVNKTII